MSLTTSHEEARNSGILPSGQQGKYVILSDEERAKGFVRPVFREYKHLKCGTTTTMGLALCETYARNPSFYSGTFCCWCKAHFPLRWEGNHNFEWPDGSPVGSTDTEAKQILAERRTQEAEKHLGTGI